VKRASELLMRRKWLVGPSLTIFKGRDKVARTSDLGEKTFSSLRIKRVFGHFPVSSPPPTRTHLSFQYTSLRIKLFFSTLIHGEGEELLSRTDYLHSQK